ncbi:MAG: TIGR02281 family clan AA aspartic protease [Pseudomonadales bacterium]|jgi:aspartyl protease family protein|nr:TIGR02281 family clan AA aspartic protease [Pseudomonadales bacterium]MDP7144085.1 TIGR02281 family clan AA aspartic protease [Pseudomonadales bacterium]MDP7359348.1 TIGR02281 family clan AA aspartic protease [Pseudomonadales bacterium]MDP7594680.1 TIGR02281 family clan AA aspartic protease [Pseudomonadales bacterium]|tara:strand:- start:7564 stop:8082 length:519 start_codon:yes stop_codon:yes gene_type:complete
MEMQPGKNLGRGMLLIACVIAMALMTVFFADLEDEQRNPNRSPQSRQTTNHIEVVLERSRSGHYVVSGTINRKPVEFLLDTGATDVVIPIRTAEYLNLRMGKRSQAMTANGPITVYPTRIAELTIGDIRLNDIRASINPNMQPQGILLGMSALKQIEFIQRGNTLTLRQYGH